MTNPEMPPPIVDSNWLQSQLMQRPDDVITCDVRSTMSGADSANDFLGRHLPRARLVLLESALAVEPAGTEGRHPLPTPAAFADALGALGIGNDATVVAYDNQGGAFAGRLVWMLRIIGQPAALLDGGTDAWSGPMETGLGATQSVERETVEWPPDAIADADQVVDHIATGGVVIDSRAAERYAGEIEPIDAVAGHVPGAINLVFGENLGPDGRFRAPAQLAERFSEARTDPSAIVYCGSGVTACHNALAMEYAGLELPRVYVGSWSGWSFDTNRPVATGGN
jgi:thiosulfate/3-mercaptopyruvate sulfurtransferase